MAEPGSSASSRSEEYLGGFANRALKALEAHHTAARFWTEVDRWWLGLAALVSSLVGAFLAGVVAIQDDPGGGLRTAAAVSVAAAASLEVLRLQLRPHDLSERHHMAAVRFSATRRRAEALSIDIAEGRVPDGSVSERLNELVDLYDEAGMDAPTVPRRIWKDVQQKLKGRRLEPGAPYYPDLSPVTKEPE